MPVISQLALLAVNLNGLWHAWVLNSDGERVEFQLQLNAKAGQVEAALVNGRDRVTSTAGRLDGGRLHLEWSHLDAVLDADLRDGSLDGNFTRTWRKTKLARKLHAQRAPFERRLSPPGGDLTGEWLLHVQDETKSVWRARFQQNNHRVQGVLIPVTGDSGEMTGVISGGELRLHRFDGIRTMLLKATLGAGGKLAGTLNSTTVTYKVTGERATESSANAPDPLTHTRMRQPAEPFRFSFPDLNGRALSSQDLLGKAVIVTITGSWCPNCHEEVPVLQELYERYRSEGLEVVALAFEYTGDIERDRRQLRLFAAKHGLTFPILLAGTTEDAPAKLPQLENFGAYPTTIFLGRDGRVQAIHAGFDGPATGDRFLTLKQEMTKLVEKILAVKAK